MSLCSLSLSSARTQRSNSVINARANDTTTCSDVQTAHRNGECRFTEPRSLSTCLSLSSTARNTPSKAADPEPTPQVFADQRTSGGDLHIPASGGVEQRPRDPAADCSELHFSAWTPLRRILPHRRSYIAAGGTAIVENARQSHTWQWASGHVRSRSEECM